MIEIIENYFSKILPLDSFCVSYLFGNHAPNSFEVYVFDLEVKLVIGDDWCRRDLWYVKGLKDVRDYDRGFKTIDNALAFVVKMKRKELMQQMRILDKLEKEVS